MQPLDRRFKKEGCCRKENRKPAGYIPNLLGQPGKPFRPGCVERLVFQAGQKGVDLAFILAVIRQKFAKRLAGESAKAVIIMLASRGSENAQRRRDQFVRVQGIKRRQQHAPRQIARGAEQQQCLAMLAHTLVSREHDRAPSTTILMRSQMTRRQATGLFVCHQPALIVHTHRYQQRIA